MYKWAMEGAFLGTYWAARGAESQYSAQERSSWQLACLLAIKFPPTLRKNSLPCTCSATQANIFLKIGL